MTKRQRQKEVEKQLRNGASYRQAAQALGVHHRTVQRDAEELLLRTVYSEGAMNCDFTKKGQKLFNAIQAKKNTGI